MQYGPIVAVDKSQNIKTGKVAATYAPLTTCPASCPLKGAGCYAEQDRVGMKVRELNRISEGMDTTTLANMEADAIDQLDGKRPLRMHVSGDASTPEAAAILNEAAARYKGKHNQPAWTYTHAWREVDRETWSDVSVLASVHTTEDAKLAMKRGYTPAIVYTAPQPERKAWTQDGIKIVPCPAQSHENVTCESCRLCMRQTDTPSIAIGFQTHGAMRRSADKAAVEVTR